MNTVNDQLAQKRSNGQFITIFQGVDNGINGELIAQWGKGAIKKGFVTKTFAAYAAIRRWQGANGTLMTHMIG